MALIPTFPNSDTMQITWVDSSISVADDAIFKIFTGSETLANTGTLSSSGNGHYYNDFTIPGSYSYGFYVAETVVVVGGKPYRRRKNFKVMPLEVD